MNTNCLKGMACPKCGQVDRFHVDAITTVTLTDDGTTEHEGAEFDANHAAACTLCDWCGLVGDLYVPGFDVTFELVTPESAEHGDADRRGWWMPGEWLYEDRPDEMAFAFDPEDYDKEEHDTLDEAIIQWAVSLLNREGACHPNQSPSDGAEWWSTESETHSYETGATISKSFHFCYFTDEQKREINRRLA